MTNTEAKEILEKIKLQYDDCEEYKAESEDME